MARQMTYSARRGKQRRPWLAAVLSLVQPGLGQVYAGRLRRGLVVLALLQLAAFAGQRVFLTIPGGSSLAALVLTNAALLLGASADALFVARAAPATYFLDRSNSWYGYAGMLTLGVALGQLNERVRVIEAFRIPSGSMAETILPGDWVFVDKRASTRHVIGRKVLVTYRSPDDSSIALKRVVGIQGDTLLMRNDTLVRNGKVIDEPYATIGPSPLPDSILDPMRNWGPVIISGDSIFVLGDNRHASKDSRHVGPIAIENVLGRPRVIYYSFDPESEAALPFLTAVRWKRLGMSPQ